MLMWYASRNLSRLMSFYLLFLFLFSTIHEALLILVPLNFFLSQLMFSFKDLFKFPPFFSISESKQIRARKYKTKSSNNLQNIEKHQSKLSSSLDTKPKEIELLKLPSDKNEKFLKIPSVELTKEISSNTLGLPPTVSPFHMSISAYNCSTPKVKVRTLITFPTKTSKIYILFNLKSPRQKISSSHHLPTKFK